MAICTAPPYTKSSADIVGSWNFHHLAVAISCLAIIITVVAHWILALTHLLHPVRVREQSLILRIIGVPIAFSISAVFSVAYYNAAPYIKDVPIITESIGLVAIFELMVIWVAPDNEGAKRQFFNNNGGWLKFKTTSLAVYQYFIVSVIVLVITDVAAALQCPTSHAAKVTQIITAVINVASTGFAIISIIKFYKQFKSDLKPRGTVGKLVGLKLIVGVTTLQGFVINIIRTNSTVEKGTRTLSYGDIVAGIPNLLIALEMLVFGTLYFWFYTTKPYRHIQKTSAKRQDKFASAIQVIIEAANIIDIFRGIAEGFGTLAAIQQARSGYGPDYEMDSQEDYYKPQNSMAGQQPYYPPPAARPDVDMGRQATPGSYV